MIALFESNSVVEASKKTGITEQTGHKYLKNPIFKERYRKLRREKFEQATANIVNSVDEAIQVLKDVMNNDEEVGATRVQSARAIISNAFKSYELQEIEERLDNIEELLQDKRGDY